jgi:Flp pilus assembly protein TadB
MTVSTPADDAPSLKASLRIPVANLAAAIKDLRGLGQVASEQESGEDVTQQHADLDQRLKTARDTEERFRTILQQRTGTVNDVLQVEEEIARVRGDIESMEAEQANLEHRVDFASIDLSVTGESNPVSGSAPLSVRVRSAFVAGYRNAVGTVIGVFLFLAAYGLTILIWIALLGLPVYLLRRRYRRMRAKL